MKSELSGKKNFLKNTVWEKDEYFSLAKDASLQSFLKNLGLRRIREYAARAPNILDVGCGDGVNIEMIWQKKAEFWGIDISEKAILLANKRLKSKNNVHFRVGNIEKIDFPDESF